MSTAPYLTSISRLDGETRRIVLSLLDHQILKRLKSIQQLGYASKVFPRATHSRWDHTLRTIDALCRLLEAEPTIPNEIRRHLLAAAVLQDVGHAPLSNSLGPIFGCGGGTDVGGQVIPRDKLRTIRIIKHIEQTEGLFSRLGLQVDTLIQLLSGRFPWSHHEWSYRFVESGLDADRFAYVEQDAALTLDKAVGDTIGHLARSLEADGPAAMPIISVDGAQHLRSFISDRSDLVLNVYHHIQKLSWEYVMRGILIQIWKDKKTEQADLAPQDVAAFLTWDDARLEAVIARAKIRNDLIGKAIRDLYGDLLFVTEVDELAGPSRSFDEIDEALAKSALRTFPDQMVWLIKSSDIPKVSLYENKSILIKDKGRHRFLEDARLFPSEALTLRRRPIVVIPENMFPAVTDALNAVGLTLGQLQRISRPQQ